MTKYKLEYIWLDGKKPVPDLRGKTLIKTFDKPPTLGDLPNWGFDGSSTMQAEGRKLRLRAKAGGSLSGRQPQGRFYRSERSPAPGPHAASHQHARDHRERSRPVDRPRAGILPVSRTGVRWASRKTATPALRKARTTAALAINIWADLARKIVDEHLELCLAAGINHEGINSEVAKGQWEFQIFAKGSAKAADDTWTARYLMLRLCEKYEVDMVLHCKPIKGDWNGSGMHCNFSTKYMREVGGKEYFESLMKAFEANIPSHIAVYGPDNHLRLTGLHETQAIDKFSYGLSDRGASIRMPVNFIKNGYKGYLEDRRPNSEGDPYQIVSRILKTINSVGKPAAVAV